MNLHLVSEFAQKSTFVVEELFESKMDLESGVYNTYPGAEANLIYGSCTHQVRERTAEEHDGAFDYYDLHEEVKQVYRSTGIAMASCSCLKPAAKVP